MTLEEDLESEVDRATPLEQVDRVVQVDVVAGGEHQRALGVVPGALELLVTPALDPVDLGERCMTSRSAADMFIALPQLGDCVPRLFVHYDVRDFPFLGGLR